MSIYDPYGRPVTSARFLDAAGNDGSRPVQQVRTESIRKSVTWFDWRTVVSASRKLYANFGIGNGVITQCAMYSIGDAWRAIYRGSDTAWGRVASDWLNHEWLRICDITGEFDFTTNLYRDSIAIDRDGDFGINFTTGDGGYPMLQRIANHRIRSQPGETVVGEDSPYVGCKINHGIIYNKIGRSVAFRVHEDPMNATEFVEPNYKDISARDFLHVYDPQWYDQGRGWPVFVPVLNDLLDMKQSKEWEQISMLVRSAISLIEYNETGAADSDDPRNLADGSVKSVTGLNVQSFEGGLIRYLRANSGAKLDQFTSMNPSDSWDRFNDRLTRLVCLVYPWPYSMAWKKEGGGTDTRADIGLARLAVKHRQQIFRPVFKRCVLYAISKAIELKILPNSSEWYRWDASMPAQMGIDDGRDRQGRIDALDAGVTTLEEQTAATGESGGNWISLRDQREREAMDLCDRAVRIATKYEWLSPVSAMALIQRANPNQQIQDAPTEAQPSAPPKNESQ